MTEKGETQLVCYIRSILLLLVSLCVVATTRCWPVMLSQGKRPCIITVVEIVVYRCGTNYRGSRLPTVEKARKMPRITVAGLNVCMFY